MQKFNLNQSYIVSIYLILVCGGRDAFRSTIPIIFMDLALSELISFQYMHGWDKHNFITKFPNISIKQQNNDNTSLLCHMKNKNSNYK